ncbi:TetR/AcrR family transcriptional regulator [Saccharothrix obliqua]|uniref:TetR/AcrR family transcriptional regulator n=1 Tax=Saccharothrix obliqua TaxID=2861747 RepID=UPI001C5FA279|nr:TetR/AcrR family transcriptional regulator [Saccharothrix obliqua]MBW4717545.1 TetR/AcrR family transcriptional regulator [Saccharothrix obliqua]
MSPRADAVRNRTAILAAARVLMVARGPDVGMDDIAAGAGVAVGTLYRHFPTKAHLVEAIAAELAAVIAEVLDAALGRIDDGRSRAADEVLALLRRVVVDMGQERLLRDAVAGPGSDALHDIRDNALRSLAKMVDLAHAEGALRPDVTVEDIALLLAWSPDARASSHARERWVTLAHRALFR